MFKIGSGQVALPVSVKTYAVEFICQTRFISVLTIEHIMNRIKMRPKGKKFSIIKTVFKAIKLFRLKPFLVKP